MADVSIDGAVSTSSARGMRSLVWHPTDPNVGWHFYIDSDADFCYSKTVDGGATWGAAVQVGPDDTDLAFDVWADWWTPGDTGTRIHMVWFGTGLDDILYNYIETEGSPTDSLGTQRVVEAETSAATGVGVHCSITKSVGGNLYVSWECDVSGERGFERSTDGGVNWTARTIQQEAAGDWSMLFPANAADPQDIWAVYFDTSTNTLTVKVYDDSGNAWTETSGQSVIDSTVDLTAQYPFSATVRHSDGHLLVALFTNFNNANSDLLIWDVTASGSTPFATINSDTVWLNLQNVYYPSIFIDQNTDDIYIAYNGSQANDENPFGSASHIYYTKSGDGGANWDAEVQYSEGSTSAKVQTWAPPMGARFYASWRVGSTLLGNAVNSLTFEDAGTVADLTQTLGTVTAASEGAVAIAGAFGQTLGTLSLSSEASVGTGASLTQTLEALAIEFAGGQEQRVADLAQALGALVLESASAEAVAASLAQTLDAMVVDSAAAVGVAADLGQTLGTASLSSAASLGTGAAVTVTLGAASLDAAAGAGVAGDLASTLGDATLSSTAEVTDGNTGDLEQTLEDLASSSAAAAAVAGSVSQTLDTLTAGAAGSVAIAAALTQTLGDVTLDSTGGDFSLIADLAVTLGDVTLDADGGVSQPETEPQPETGHGAGQPARRKRRRKPAFTVDEVLPQTPRPRFAALDVQLEALGLVANAVNLTRRRNRAAAIFLTMH